MATGKGCGSASCKACVWSVRCHCTVAPSRVTLPRSLPAYPYIGVKDPVKDMGCILPQTDTNTLTCIRKKRKEQTAFLRQ